MTLQYLHTEIAPPLATIALNRPDVHNALHIDMIRELSGVWQALESDQGIKLVSLTSSGKHFCSGADLNWMREGMNQSGEQLMKESLELAELFWSLHSSRLITIVSVRGRAMGGAIGLVAASDIVLAETSSVFAFSEVRLGLIPATIAPYALKKMGYSRTLELMLSGRNFTADMALQYGLAHHVCEEGKLDEFTGNTVDNLILNGPEAMQSVKSLLDKLVHGIPPEDTRSLTAELIARHRISAEGQEGINAFFEKRDPNWYGTS
jgi:methylglutaconyl-CoA hydratase